MISMPTFALEHCGLAVGGYFELGLVSGPAIVLKPHFGPPGGNGTQAKPEDVDEGQRPE